MRERISESDGGTFYQPESSSGATEAVSVEARSKIQGDNKQPASVSHRDGALFRLNGKFSSRWGFRNDGTVDGEWNIIAFKY